MEGLNSKIFKCTICNTTYKYKHALKRHSEGKHGIVDDSISQKKNVKCELCEKHFGQRKDMLRHIRTIHNNKESEHFNNEVKTTIPDKNTITQSFHNNEYLQSILPEGYNYHVDETKFLENGQFIVRFEIYNFKYDEISSWILQFNQKSKTTYLVTNVRKSELPSVLFKKRYRCHHNTRPKKTATPCPKHFNCKSTICIQIVENEMEQVHDLGEDNENMVVENTKAIVDFKFIHNHEIMRADVLKYRKPSEEVKATFLNFFKEGKTPAKALFSFKTQLRIEKGNNYYVYAGDRGELPNPEWVYNLYYKTFNENFGASHGEPMIDSLRNAVNQYNDECSSTCALMETLEDGNFAIVIASPLMKRISSGVHESGEILFIDASGNVDRYGCKIFLIYTNSCAGGLLICTLILTSESSRIISLGLELWKKLLPQHALGGRGINGPKIFMSDDSAAERNALREAFPQSTLLLCIFHVLQAAWRYLWDSHHGIILQHRQILYNKIKKMLYSKTFVELEMFYHEVINDDLTKQYSRFESYVVGLFQRRNEWALCLRQSLITRGQNTNNICEAGVKIVKDTILDRTKAYSPVQLFFFIVNDLDAFYEMKLLDIAANRPAQYLKRKFLLTESQKEHLEFKDLGSIYEVKNNHKNTLYHIDLDLGICSCPEGCTGKPCKHQIFVASSLNVDLTLCLPTNEDTRKTLHIIATGSSEIENGWYGSILKQPQSISVNTENEIKQNININCVQDTITNDVKMEENDNMENNESETASNGLQMFDEMVQKMRDVIKSDETYFTPGIKAMSNSFKKNVKTHASLLSAMMTFGKYSGLDPTSKKLKLVGNKRIGTQPTARSRRTTEIKGRKNLAAGRVPKWKRIPEHSYGSQPNSSVLPHTPKPFNSESTQLKPQKMPHNLSYCVEQNKRLGATHSAK